ncbi:helix-turn-helix domain-containing protein [Nocardioides sp.]|uniref:helix-turn-helix domain-containing protein n=1 Tax=Nocardioides sp. TaxID=35761 RepID=UPI00345D4142
MLPDFADTAGTRSQTPEQRARLRAFVATEYQRGRSLRELAELTGRTQTAVRRALDEVGVERRGPGAPPVNTAK